MRNRTTLTGKYIHGAPRDHNATHAALCRPGGWIMPRSSSVPRVLAEVRPIDEPITCGKCLGIIALAYDEACILRGLINHGIALAASNSRRWTIHFSDNPYRYFTDQDVENLLSHRKRVFDEALMHKDAGSHTRAGQRLTEAAQQLHELLNERERRAQFGRVEPIQQKETP